MGRANQVTKTFNLGTTTWIAPAGVSSVQLTPALALSRMSGGLYLDPLGNSYGLGSNGNGQLGTGDINPRSSPVGVVGGLKFTQIIGLESSTLALDTLGNAWAWGSNGNGELGTNDITSRSSPVAVVGGLKLARVSTGYGNSAALDFSGNAWCWGAGVDGALGNGDPTGTSQSSPVAVVGGLKFSQIATGEFFALGLDSSGNAYGWGINSTSQLANAFLTLPCSTPVAVLGGLKFSQIACGLASSFALDFNGNAYAWGRNDLGQLGVGDHNTRSTPTPIVGGLKFTQIAASYQSVCAIDSSGTPWAWGENNSGQVGDGTVTNRSSPVAVIGGQKFTRVFPIGQNTMGGVDGLGNAWSWGSGGNGQLGNGGTVASSSPVPVIGGLKFSPFQNQESVIVSVVPGTSYTVVVGQYFVSFGGMPVGTAANQLILNYRQ